MPKTIEIRVVGCKVNQVEAETLQRRFEAAGWRAAAPGHAPDAVLVHTCTVTGRADRDSRKSIQAAHAAYPRAAVVVSGCLAELERDALAALPGVAAVIGRDDRERAVKMTEAVLGGICRRERTGADGCAPAATGFFHADSGPMGGRARAWIKIEDGCDGACAFCRVRLARGKPVSRPLPDILSEARARLQAGFRELVLTGVNVGCWRPGLPQAVDALAALPGHFRFRLSSLEPQHLNADLISALERAGERCCPHLHVAVQSADDGVLKAMRRTYSARDLAARISLLRRRLPGIVLTADVIVGFPGESREAFGNTRRFLQEHGFARVHVFPFSPRPGTPAADFPEQFVSRERIARARELRMFGAELYRGHLRGQAGRAVTVLLERALPGGDWLGTTEHYDKAVVKSDQTRGSLASGRVARAEADRLVVQTETPDG